MAQMLMSWVPEMFGKGRDSVSEKAKKQREALKQYIETNNLNFDTPEKAVSFMTTMIAREQHRIDPKMTVEKLRIDENWLMFREYLLDYTKDTFLTISSDPQKRKKYFIGVTEKILESFGDGIFGQELKFSSWADLTGINIYDSLREPPIDKKKLELDELIENLSLLSLNPCYVGEQGSTYERFSNESDEIQHEYMRKYKAGKLTAEDITRYKRRADLVRRVHDELIVNLDLSDEANSLDRIFKDEVDRIFLVGTPGSNLKRLTFIKKYTDQARYALEQPDHQYDPRAWLKNVRQAPEDHKKLYNVPKIEIFNEVKIINGTSKQIINEDLTGLAEEINEYMEEKRPQTIQQGLTFINTFLARADYLLNGKKKGATDKIRKNPVWRYFQIGLRDELKRSEELLNHAPEKIKLFYFSKSLNLLLTNFFSVNITTRYSKKGSINLWNQYQGFSFQNANTTEIKKIVGLLFNKIESRVFDEYAPATSNYDSISRVKRHLNDINEDIHINGFPDNSPYKTKYKELHDKWRAFFDGNADFFKGENVIKAKRLGTEINEFIIVIRQINKLERELTDSLSIIPASDPERREITKFLSWITHIKANGRKGNATILDDIETRHRNSLRRFFARQFRQYVPGNVENPYE